MFLKNLQDCVKITIRDGVLNLHDRRSPVANTNIAHSEFRYKKHREALSYLRPLLYFCDEKPFRYSTCRARREW